MSDSQQRTIGHYRDLLQTMATAAALKSALQIGLLDPLRSGQRSLKQLSEACQIVVERIEPLFAVLLSMGVVEKYGDSWALSQAAHLLVGPDADAGNALFADLDQYLRDPNFAPPLSRFRERLTARQWTRTPAAMRLANVLEIGTTRTGLRVLELGGGAGVWGAAMAFRDPTMRITTIDSAENLCVARETMKSIDSEDRWIAVAADYRKFHLPLGEFDLVLVPEVVQLEDDPAAVTLLGRAADALDVAGEIALIEPFWDERAITVPMSVSALEIAIGAPGGRLRSVLELEMFLRGAGFANARWTNLGTAQQEIGVILAKRHTAGLWQNLGV